MKCIPSYTAAAINHLYLVNQSLACANTFLEQINKTLIGGRLQSFTKWSHVSEDWSCLTGLCSFPVKDWKVVLTGWFTQSVKPCELVAHLTTVSQSETQSELLVFLSHISNMKEQQHKALF